MENKDREADIETLCHGVLMTNIKSTGDYGSGGCCPFCYADCAWDANDVSEIQHDLNCIVLIAKDLLVK